MGNSPSDKRTVLTGIMLAWLLSAGFIACGAFWGPTFEAAGHATGFALTTAGFSLIAGIGWAARTRHLVGGIGGGRPPVGSSLDLTLRYVTNTTEQIAIFVPGCLALVAVDPALATRVLPAMGLWFAIARALFWAGYRIDPLWRSVGFAATFHPTILLHVLVLARLLG